MTSAELLPEIMKLSHDDKLVVADALWRALHADEPVDEVEFNRELDRRVADADEHPKNMVPWDEALRQLRARR